MATLGGLDVRPGVICAVNIGSLRWSLIFSLSVLIRDSAPWRKTVYM